MDVFLLFVGPYVHYSMFSHPEAMPEDFHWLFIGAAGAITPLHIDPSLTHAWLTQISGRKRFTLFAPWDIPALLSNETDRFLVKIGFPADRVGCHRFRKSALGISSVVGLLNRCIVPHHLMTISLAFWVAPFKTPAVPIAI